MSRIGTYNGGEIYYIVPEGETSSSIAFKTAINISDYFAKKTKENKEKLERYLPFYKLNLSLNYNKEKIDNYALNLEFVFDKTLKRDICKEKNVSNNYVNTLSSGFYKGKIHFLRKDEIIINHDFSFWLKDNKPINVDIKTKQTQIQVLKNGKPKKFGLIFKKDDTPIFSRLKRKEGFDEEVLIGEYEVLIIMKKFLFFDDFKTLKVDLSNKTKYKLEL